MSERHRIGADPLDGAVIDLARQQPQRQADQARANAPACVRWRGGSFRYWSARARRSRRYRGYAGPDRREERMKSASKSPALAPSRGKKRQRFCITTRRCSGSGLNALERVRNERRPNWRLPACSTSFTATYGSRQGNRTPYRVELGTFCGSIPAPKRLTAPADHDLQRVKECRSCG